MSSFILMAASALIIAIGGTPLVRYAALQLGILDQPSARKIHRAPVPLMGGAAIYVAFIAALTLWGERSYVNEVVGIFVGATLVSLVGALDDSRGVGSYFKLLFQVAAACILVFSGVQVRLFDGFLDVILTLFWVVGVTNAFNLLDNMDGLSSGVATISAAFFTLLAAIERPVSRGYPGCRALRRLRRLSRLQLESGSRLYGGHREPLPRFPPCRRGHQTAFPRKHGKHNLDDSHSRAGVARLRHEPGLHQPPAPRQKPSHHRRQRSRQPQACPRTGSQREAVLLCYLITGGTGLASIFLTQANLEEALIVGLTALALGVFALWKLEFQNN